MVRTREELLESIRNKFGDDTSDETLAIIEDISDTMNDYENRTNKDGVNWQERYEENDKMWREKYRDRFFNSNPGGADTDDEVFDEGENEVKTFEDLFKTEG